MIDRQEVAREALVLRVLADRVKAAQESARGVIREGMPEGSRETVKIDGRELGKVWVTDPKARAKVVDEAALVDWLAEHRVQAMCSRLVLGDPHQVAAVLAEAGRDDLFAEELYAPDWLVKEALALAESGDEVPGVELVAGAPSVTIKPSTCAADMVERLWRDGLLELPGGAQ